MSGKLRQAARRLASSTVAAAQPFRWAVQVKSTTGRQTTGLVEVERVGTGQEFWAQVRNSVYLAAGDLVWVVKDPSAQGNWIFDGFVKGAGTGESLNGSPIPSVQTPIVTSPDGTPLIIRPITGQQGTIGRAGETINFAGAINVAEGITFAALGAGIVQSSAGGVLSSDYTIDATTTWATGTNILPVDAAGQDLGDATHRWDLFGAVADISVENIAAGGGNSLQAFIWQTDGTGMTGVLRGAYITASGGNTANTGTIRGAEIKARAGRPGETGNDVAVLEGFSVSSDAKTYDVATHRGGEIILDGGAGTSTLAVGLRIANNFQANRATTSYGLQIYRDSFDYTADIQLSYGHTIADGASAITLDTSLSVGGNITMPDGAWQGIGAALERIVFDAAGDISIMGAILAVGTLTPSAAASVHTYRANDNNIIRLEQTGAGNFYSGFIALTDDNQIVFAAYDDAYADVAEYAGKAVFQGGEADIAIVAWTAGFGIELYTGGRLAANKRVVVDADGAVIFVGSGGLIFGSCYGNHIAWQQAAAAQNTWYNVSDADMVSGPLHNVTHDGNGMLTVTEPGMYLVTYSICFQDDAANDHVEAGIEVSSSGAAEVAGQCHLENKFASEEEHMSSSTILDLADNATLEVCIRTTDAGTPTIDVQAVNLTCVQIGGT